MSTEREMEAGQESFPSRTLCETLADIAFEELNRESYSTVRAHLALRFEIAIRTAFGELLKSGVLRAWAPGLGGTEVWIHGRSLPADVLMEWIAEAMEDMGERQERCDNPICDRKVFGIKYCCASCRWADESGYVIDKDSRLVHSPMCNHLAQQERSEGDG